MYNVQNCRHTGLLTKDATKNFSNQENLKGFRSLPIRLLLSKLFNTISSINTASELFQRPSFVKTRLDNGSPIVIEN